VKDAEGKKKPLRELTEEEHIPYEDAELAKHIDDRLEVWYFYGDKLKYNFEPRWLLFLNKF